MQGEEILTAASCAGSARALHEKWGALSEIHFQDKGGKARTCVRRLKKGEKHRSRIAQANHRKDAKKI